MMSCPGAERSTQLLPKSENDALAQSLSVAATPRTKLLSPPQSLQTGETA